MQNALQAALVATGVVTHIPQNEQIWRVVREDQPCDYTHIAKRTGLKATNVSSLLGAMEKRGMVHSRGAKGKGSRGTRREYMTDLDTFELLPPPKPGLRDMLIDRVHSSKQGAQATIDALTVAEARELWGILNRMFGQP